MDEQMREKLYAAWAEAGWDDEFFVIGESMWSAALSQPAAAQGDSSHSAGGECGGVTEPTVADEAMLQALKTTALNIRSLGPAGAIQWPYKVWLSVVEDAIAKATT